MNTYESTDVLIGYCTFPSEDSAIQVFERLLAERTVACANILSPHTAMYSWKGRVQKEKEVAVIFKTITRKQSEIRERIQAIHPYELPCLVFWPVTGGHPDFLKWVCGECL